MMSDFFSVRRFLGSGRTSDVYSCDHSLLGVPVAVKLVDKSQINEKVHLHIRREIELLSDIKHMNIVTMFGVLESEEKIAIVMEYCTNGTLFSSLKSPGEVMDEQVMRKYFSQLVSAIDYLHNEKHIIHRDIKPQNILIDRYYNIKLADFGLSSHEEDMKNTRCGSPCYCSPEMLNKQPYSYETDIWSMGIVLYFLTTNQLPFQDENMHNLFQKIMSRPITFPTPTTPNASGRTINPELQDLILRMLEKDPSQRITIQQIKEHPWLKYQEMLPFLQQVTNALCAERH